MKGRGSGGRGGYCVFRGEERLSGQRSEAWGPPQPRMEQTCRRGQSFRRHRPRLKLIQVSRARAACRGPAAVPRDFRAGPSEYKWQAIAEWPMPRQRGQVALALALPGPVKARE